MAESRPVVYISSDSELGRALRAAAATGEPVVIDTGETQYEIDIYVRRDARHPLPTDEPDAILGIIGILESAEPSNIARFKTLSEKVIVAIA